ncbi:MAG TPA: efflux RND transporter periplasmic adaptor subunit [Herbaspirillum sp.]|uniref:efflux RND transporter periplasmic adaptor subunit n=1 Tax=Herbaspirillum sp. TaxID=1890675 RepID=UPI002D4226BC|nr:efflux RND transporter periplasmic adaptor subunit [Herbaspirillum sp.]HZG18447.1 efflux RND transporter periplasmic adaptor subunit [Herbaspirillum sp.]
MKTLLPRLPRRTLLSATLLLSLAACDHPPPPAESVAKVAWTTVQPATTERVSFTGVVHARTESKLGFRVAGKIVERLVDPGQTVRRGQALMRIDAEDYDLALAAARAAVEAAQARQVQAVAEEARLRKLLEHGATSSQAYELAKAAADAAVAQTRAEAAKARETEHQRDYAVLKADMDGVVLAVPSDVGQVVAAGQNVVTLARDGAREALVYLPEQELGMARRSATASLFSDPDKQAPATLRELAAVADPQTRTYLARYALGGTAAHAALGATVTIHVATPAATGVTLPISALVDQGKGSGVWVIDAKTNTVSLQAVKVEQLGAEQVRISDGLVTGQRVVAMGGHLLKAGQKVALLTETRMGSGT